MRSIRRNTAMLVALSMLLLLVFGGVALRLVLGRAMTARFDDGLLARAGALKSLIRFDGERVEVDIIDADGAGSAGAEDACLYVVWVQDGPGWRILKSSEQPGLGSWVTAASGNGAPGPRDAVLPGGDAGRVAVTEFAPAREGDEDEEPRGGGPPRSDATGAAQTASVVSPRARLLVALARDPLDRTLRTISWAIAGVGVGLLVVSIAAAHWAVGRGLVPLIDLSRRVRALGPETLSARFDTAGLPAELAPIAEQLSGLIARLDEAFEREKRFSAAASHELRTPIAELRMLLEVSVSRARTSEQWARTAESALGVVGRAQALCDALLRLSRAGTEGTGQNGAARAEACASLDRESARAANRLGVEPGRISVEWSRPMEARIDPAILDSILSGLFENALRHGASTRESPVTARATGDRTRVCIDIENSAPSLTDDDLTRLFEPFWRKDPSRADQDGFGLGLSVARALARAAKGDLTAALSESGILRMRLVLPAA